MATGEKMPDNVKLIIEDSGYTSAWDLFSYHLKNDYNLPSFLVMSSTEIVTFVKSGYLLTLASSVKQLKDNKKPILFIHGNNDKFVPFAMLDELYNATTSFKEKLVIEGAGHAESSKIDPSLYWSTIEKFIEKYL
jgi:fermentation-respiration switch protein FrsA (DUF1100 family)